MSQRLNNDDFLKSYVIATDKINRIYRQDKALRYMRLVEEMLKTEGALPIAECGVFTGLTGLLLCEYMGDSEYHGFDSFLGLEPTAEDDDASPLCRSGLFKKSPKFAESVLPDSAMIHVGRIPEVLHGQPERKYRFVHIDVDCYKPTLTSLQYFWPRMQSGGRIVCDDFEWKGAQRAFKEFGEPHSFLDTGQAVWVKDTVQ